MNDTLSAAKCITRTFLTWQVKNYLINYTYRKYNYLVFGVDFIIYCYYNYVF